VRRHDAALDVRGTRKAKSWSVSRRNPEDLGARVPRESKAQTCLRTPNRRHDGLECGGMMVWSAAA